ncbi:MAG: hypothetical protein DWQ05_06710 [Calditrichaeota bacterium]|nr:MAG: hypothetical protein DWQ05_06710 [Calditrichota bacterium]
MGEKLIQFLGKFSDNAHIGKIATDFAPGIILTFSILLLLASFTELEVFPHSNVRKYRKQAKQAESALHESTTLVNNIQRQIDHLEAELENKTIVAEEREEKRTQLSVQQKTLKRAKSALDEKIAATNKATENLQNAGELKSNLTIFADHFMMLFFAGYLIGIILAQVSGKIFYNGYFNKFFKEKYRSVYDTLYHKDHHSATYIKFKITDQDFLQRLPNLETDYFRYLEIAMNMVLPVGVLALTLFALGTNILLASGFLSALFPLILALAAFAATAFLYLNARVLYVGYFMKKADVMKLLQEKHAEESGQ